MIDLGDRKIEKYKKNSKDLLQKQTGLGTVKNTIDKEERLREIGKIYKEKLPLHIGFTPDGNRRWSYNKGVSTNVGHYRGYEVVRSILLACFHVGIKYLSLYALSLENAKKRSPEELKYIYKIIKLAVETVKKEPIVTEERIKFNVIGRLELLPKDVRDKMNEIVEYTKDFDGAYVNVLVMYDGQTEIVDAMKKILTNKVNPEDINRKLIKNYLYTKDFPELDYLIRTGMSDGARISGFLLWDASYAEFKFRNEFWPEYNEDLLIEDLFDFINRNRRKGK